MYIAEVIQLNSVIVIVIITVLFHEETDLQKIYQYFIFLFKILMKQIDFFYETAAQTS